LISEKRKYAKAIDFLKSKVMDGVVKITQAMIFIASCHLGVVYQQWWRCFDLNRPMKIH
jgi:hypothetical protein